jgi:CelD/BcsL family acetyltransferase involved in cellulose biosynthesis
MIIERIESAAAFGELRHEWNSVVDASKSRCVFLTHEWLSTWWKYLAENRTLWILAARAQGRLVGVLPLAFRPPQYSRMIPTSLEFIGSGVIGSDYLDAVVMPGLEQDVIPRFAGELARKDLPVHLTTVREPSVAAEMARHLRKAGWNVGESEMNVCPYIDLQGKTFQTYLSSLSSSQRYNFNRRLRNLQKDFAFSVEIAKTPDAAQDALEAVLSLHRKRWSPRDRSEAFHNSKTVAFHRDFVELAAQRGWLRILQLKIDGTAVAALYGLRYGDTFYFYQSGFDPSWSRQSVGLVMMGLAIQSAIEDGALEYDFLHGQEEYKFHWTQQTRPIGRLELYPKHSRGRLSRHAVDLNRAMRKMAKRMLLKAA